MIETWGFYLFTSGRNDMADVQPGDYEAAFARYLDVWVKCEDWGLDGLAFAEHHFNPISLGPSPHLLIAAVAARTSRIRFATAGAVLPLNDPRRVSEEIGMLDYLTEGRFEPGIAPGAGPTESVQAGLTVDEIRPRYYSGAEIISQTLQGPYVTQHDQFSTLDNVAIVPNIRQHPGRTMWVTVMSPNSAAWTAEHGFKMVTSWLPTAAAAALADRYRDAAEAAGRSTDPSMLGLRRRVFVADTDAEAQDKFDSAQDMLAPARGFETPDPQVVSRMKHPDDFAVGSPETVAEKLIEQCRAGGYGVLMALTDTRFYDGEDFARSHELLGRRVAPLLRSADLGTHRAATLARAE